MRLGTTAMKKDYEFRPDPLCPKCRGTGRVPVPMPPDMKAVVGRTKPCPICIRKVRR